MVAITTTSDFATPLRSLHAPATATRRGVSWQGGRVAGQLGSVLLGLVAVVAVAFLLTSSPAAPGAASVPLQEATHRVAEGETMWSIAVSVAPAGEAATYVERLVAANDAATVSPGQVLVLPVP